MADVLENVKDLVKASSAGNPFLILIAGILIATGTLLIALGQVLAGTILLLTGIILAIF